MTSIRDRVFGEDGYTDTAKLATDINKLARTAHQSAKPAALAAVKAELERRILAGEKVTPEVAQPLLDAEQQDQLAVALTRAATSAADSLRAASAELRRANTGEYFKRLQAELKRVVTEGLTVVDDLRGARTAADAVAAGNRAVDAWRAIEALSGEYAEIREVQKELVKSLDTDQVRAAWQTGQFANAIDVHPYWIERRRIAAETSTAQAGEALDYVEWLRKAVRPPYADDSVITAWSTNVWPDTDHVAHFIWAITEASPWLPDPATLAAAHEAALKACSNVSAADRDHPERQRADLARYFTITGARPSLRGLVPAEAEWTRPKVRRIGGSKGRRSPNVPAEALRLHVDNRTEPIGSPM